MKLHLHHLAATTMISAFSLILGACGSGGDDTGTTGSNTGTTGSSGGDTTGTTGGNTTGSSGGNTTGTTGGNTTGSSGGNTTGTTGGASVDSTAVQALFNSSTANCTIFGCHRPTLPAANLDLTDVANTWPSLVGQAPADMAAGGYCDSTGQVIIDVDNPTNSLLYTKLSGSCGTPYDTSMPQGYNELSDQQKTVILNWIKAIAAASK